MREHVRPSRSFELLDQAAASDEQNSCLSAVQD
jgi:hypothetical protein